MSDPLGLSAEQRAWSDINQWAEDVSSGRPYEHNLKLVQELPPGTMITIPGRPPITREQALEVLFR